MLQHCGWKGVNTFRSLKPSLYDKSRHQAFGVQLDGTKGALEHRGNLQMWPSDDLMFLASSCRAAMKRLTGVDTPTSAGALFKCKGRMFLILASTCRAAMEPQEARTSSAFRTAMPVAEAMYCQRFPKP